jgi:hypothetical protein
MAVLALLVQGPVSARPRVHDVRRNREVVMSRASREANEKGTRSWCLSPRRLAVPLAILIPPRRRSGAAAAADATNDCRGRSSR